MDKISYEKPELISLSSIVFGVCSYPGNGNVGPICDEGNHNSGIDSLCASGSNNDSDKQVPEDVHGCSGQSAVLGVNYGCCQGAQHTTSPYTS